MHRGPGQWRTERTTTMICLSIDIDRLHIWGLSRIGVTMLSSFNEDKQLIIGYLDSLSLMETLVTLWLVQKLQRKWTQTGERACFGANTPHGRVCSKTSSLSSLFTAYWHHSHVWLHLWNSNQQCNNTHTHTRCFVVYFGPTHKNKKFWGTCSRSFVLFHSECCMCT